jgi:hypothetical protein
MHLPARQKTKIAGPVATHQRPDQASRSVPDEVTR